MTYSAVQICNLALAGIGQAQIQALTESSSEAGLCNLFYDVCRKQLLRDHTWNFAVKVRELAQLSETPPDFAHAYALPADYLRIISPVYEYQSASEITGSVYYPVAQPQIDPRKLIEEIRYQVRTEALTSATVIVCDEEEFWLKYVYNCSDPAKFDALFVECLQYLIASKIAYPITGEASIMINMVKAYNTALIRAQATDASENRPLDFTGYSILDSRV